MQNCGQLQASIAVALIAQSDGELCPTDMQIRAAIGRSNILRIGLPPSSPKLCARKSSHASRPELAAHTQLNGRLSQRRALAALAGSSVAVYDVSSLPIERKDKVVFEKKLLSGKKILVTGGATGLGKSMGKRFLELDAQLYI